MVQVTEINYKNFGKCVKMDNGIASVIVTVDVGPRIISYCLNGKENVLFEDVERVFSDDGEELKEMFGEDKTWYIYGGSRLWSSPESYPESYYPDNDPVEYNSPQPNKLEVSTLHARTGQYHSITIEMNENTSKLKVDYAIYNRSGAVVTLAPWALTVCAAGGVEIFPQNRHDNGLLSNRRNVLWSYSDINDDRFFLGNRYGTLKQVPGAEGKFKIGMNNEDGWAAVVNKEQIFLKNFSFADGHEFPDYGCNFETFTNGIFLECESLGPLTTFSKPYHRADLTETWELIECNESFDRKNEESIDAFAKKYFLGKCRRFVYTRMPIMTHI